MIVVISPAKTLDFESTYKIKEKETNPRFLDTTHKLVGEAKKLEVSDLEKMMKISTKLAELNVLRFKAFKKNPNTDARACAYVFKGDTYQGLEFESLNEKTQNYAQSNLRILSGLYGVLRPFDAIQPYRLEMGTRFQTTLGKNLYEVWKQKVTESLNEELKKHKVLINCASIEYFSAVDTKNLNAKVITPIFMERKNGKEKIISFNAKRARGMMAKYIIENKIKDSEEIKKFNIDNYEFQKDKSTETEFVFTRG